MSEPIRRYFENRIEKYLTTNPPQDGQLLAVSYDNSNRADKLAKALWELSDENLATLQLGDDENEIPAYTIENSTTLYIVRVRSDLSADRRSFEVTQGFGTGLRNYLLDGSIEYRNAAGFLILDRSADIDTLEAAESLSEEGRFLSPESIRADLLETETVRTSAGRVVLSAVETFLEGNLDAADGNALLEQIAHIRYAVEDEDLDDLASGIGGLPEMLHFDVLKEDFFELELAEDDAYVDFLELLQDAHGQAEILREAFAPGADTRETLRSEYNEEFVEAHATDTGWTEISFKEVRQGGRDTVIEEEEGEEGDDDGDTEEDGETQSIISERANGGSDEDGDDSPSMPSFENYEISSSEVVDSGAIQGRFTKADRRHVLRCAAAEVPIELTIHLDDSLDGINYVCTPSVDDDTVTVEASAITFHMLPEDTDEIRWERFEVYLGRTDRNAYPDIQFDIAVVPQWWYDALDCIELNIDRESDEPRFVLEGTDSMYVGPPGLLGRGQTASKPVTDNNQSIFIDAPTRIYPQPTRNDGDVAVRPFVLQPGESAPTAAVIPILAFNEDPEISTKSVRLPLAVEALVGTDDWGEEPLMIESVEVDDGVITAAGRRFKPENPRLREIVEIEEEFVDEGQPHPRTSNGQTLESDTTLAEELDLPENLHDAYGRLFEHFAERGTTPSTDPWDAETRTRVRDVVDEYTATTSQELDSEDHGAIRDIGLVHPQHGEAQSWVSSFNPLMLAYGYRIMDWRENTLADDGLTGGFSDEALASYLSPSGLLPYRSQGGDMDPFRGQSVTNHSLWMRYSPIESQGSETPDYMRDLTEEKVLEFYETFSWLFAIHPDRPLTINFFNMGGLESCLRGLVDVFETLQDEGKPCPNVELRVYGSGKQGRALDRFFSSTDENAIFSGSTSEIADKLRSKLTYTHPDADENLREAQLTFFRGVLNPEFSALEINELPDRLLREGLLPQESSRIERQSGRRQYTNGFGCGMSDSKPIHRAARYANRIEYGHRNNEQYGPDSKIARTVKSDRRARFDDILEHSAWAVHIEPPVGIEFYTDADETATDNRSPLVIHYDDTRTESTGYDIITTTNRQDLYVDALESDLNEIDRQGTTDPGRILDILAAIEGGSVTELQRANTTRVKELIGMAGTLVLSRTILRRYLPRYAWVAINLADEVQHDRSRRHARHGTLNFVEPGRASDDFMFIGIPKRRDDDGELSLKLWFAEAKGGTANSAGGVGQVEETVQRMQSKFKPSEPRADTEILRAAVGRLINEGAARLQTYSLLDSEEMDMVTGHREALLNGEYDVELLEDRHGATGEVVNVGGTELQQEIIHEDSTRIIEVPVDVVKLLENPDLEGYFPSYDVDLELGFQSN